MNDPQMATHPTSRQRLYLLLRADDPTSAAVWTRSFIAFVIILNVVAVILESHDTVYSIHGAALHAFEIASVLFFTVEYSLRIWVSAEDPQFASASPWGGRWKYLRSGMGIVDLAAIAPFYLGFFITLDLRHIRALRLLRLLKLSRSFRSLGTFSYVFRSQIPNLIAATLVIFILLVLSSSLMYAIESDTDQFANITQAMWWSIVTLSTVGYGDVIPSTPLGKLLGGFIMLLGIGLVALPAAILGGKFADELAYRRIKVTTQAFEFLKDGKLSERERWELEQRGHREGFSDEEVEEIRKNAMESIKVSQVCPKCGHTLSK
jgi:voltage-gated potassium channel